MTVTAIGVWVVKGGRLWPILKPDGYYSPFEPAGGAEVMSRDICRDTQVLPGGPA
jgi:hypothetical protein